MDLLLTQVSPSNGVESIPGNELPGSGGDSGFKELFSQQGGTSSDKPSTTDTAKSVKGQSEQVATESSAKADAKAPDDSKATSQSAPDSQSPARVAESSEQVANQGSQPSSDSSNAGSDSGEQASSEVEGLLSQLRASEAMANELADAKKGSAEATEGEDDKQIETQLAKIAQGGDSEGESAEDAVDEATKGTLGHVTEADADSASDDDPDVAVDTENTEVVLDAGKGKPDAGDSELEEGEQPNVAGDVPAELLPEGEQADTENADEATQALAKGERSGAADAQNQSQNPAVAGSAAAHAPAEGEGDGSASSTKTANAVGESVTSANSSSAAAQTAANNPVSAAKPDADTTVAATKGLEKGSEAELKPDGSVQAKVQGQLNESQTGRDLGKVQLGESVVAAKASSEALSDSKTASEGKLNLGKDLAAASALGMAAASAQDGGEKSGEFGQQSQHGQQHAAHANALASAQQPVNAPETAATRGFVDHLSQAGEARSLHQANQASANQAMPERFNPALINAGEELNQRVQMMLGQGLQRAEIRLDPAELGSMQIRVQVTNNDQASVQIQVQNPQAREALEQSMPRLREMLQQQGIELGQTQVNHQKDQQQHAHSDGRPEWAQGGEGAAGEFDDGEATSVDVAFNAAEGIDYYA